jgi:hypothetical protein
MNEEPVIVGMIRPPAGWYVPSNTLPSTLSCRHTSPGSSLPSAARHASLALVPVPHGLRSYALPGQSTKFRPWLAGSCGGPISSMWSISPALSDGSPVTPDASSASRIFQVNAVSCSAYLTSNRWLWSPTR